VIYRVHRDTTRMRPAAKPTTTPCLAETNVHMVDITDLANDSFTIHVNEPDFARWQADMGIFTFLRHKCRLSASTPRNLGTFLGLHLDATNRCPQGNRT
jgi:hypothetical protein